MGQPSFKVHRRRIFPWLKWGLPIGIVLLLGVLLMWPQIDRIMHPAPPVPSAQKESGVHMSNTVTGATMKSTDEKGRPYTTSAKIIHHVDDNHAILKAPTSELTLDDGATLSLKADQGDYTVSDKTIRYNGHVVFSSRDKGFTFTTPEAAVDFAGGKAEGNAPVHGQTDRGTVQAKNGFRIEDKGNKLVFKGPTQLTLHGGQTKTP